MQRPKFGEFNAGAMSGAVVGAVGGLFAVGLARAIIGGHLALLFDTPILGFISWTVSGVTGWFAGGQIGPRVGVRFGSQRVELVAGAVSGLVPVILIALWGWYMVTPH